MFKDARTKRNHLFLLALAVVGVCVFVIFTNLNRAMLRETLDETFTFVEARVHLYEIDEANDRVKSLTRLQDKTAALRDEMMLKDDFTPSDLNAFADTQRLSGVLVLDGDRNRWWGYDYRTGLGDAPLTEDYFLNAAKADFAARRAVNFAVRLKGKLIGEVVLYRPDFRGGFEQGCRIAPACAGHGYGTEAFAAAADWALYHLGLARVVAKCFKENAASHKMTNTSALIVRGGVLLYTVFSK